MHGRGSSRFGKYGDLKRKEKIRRNQMNRKGDTLTSLAHAGSAKSDRAFSKKSTKK